MIGPERLPAYAAKLAHGVRQLRDLAEGAKTQLRDQMGPEFDDIDWKAYDPRQYDPRRIVREALAEPSSSAADGHDEDWQPEEPFTPSRPVHDPDLPTRWDPDAT